jgi:hypothetical protein
MVVSITISIPGFLGPERFKLLFFFLKFCPHMLDFVPEFPAFALLVPLVNRLLNMGRNQKRFRLLPAQKLTSERLCRNLDVELVSAPQSSGLDLRDIHILREQIQVLQLYRGWVCEATKFVRQVEVQVLVPTIWLVLLDVWLLLLMHPYHVLLMHSPGVLCEAVVEILGLIDVLLSPGLGLLRIVEVVGINVRHLGLGGWGYPKLALVRLKCLPLFRVHLFVIIS